jgi:CheY-like chemotaxis protein
MRRAVILLAEDNADIRQLFHFILDGAGFAVIEAEDGEQALDALKQLTPDLLLVDLMMPKIDGVEVIQRVRAQAKLAHLPIVAMSAYGADYLTKAFVSGATATLRKPADSDSLIKTVCRALPKHLRGH